MPVSLSPLRYPGGKTVLAPFICELLYENKLQGGIYAEPYAGGAGAAINLLFSENVDEILINDADYCIYSFWKSILDQTKKLLKMVDDTSITIQEWKKQKKIYTNYEKYSRIKVGFATFFLNRCNRSGILMNAGPIGGKEQEGAWKIDARFNKENLKSRIERIALYKERIKVSNLDALRFIRTIVSKNPAVDKTLVYLDPPYYIKGSELYLNHYQKNDHGKVKSFLEKKHKFKWILSYDNVEPIRTLYKGMNQISFNLTYTAHIPKVGSELLIYNKSLKVPLCSKNIKKAL
jgi:DNA adenine methylase